MSTRVGEVADVAVGRMRAFTAGRTKVSIANVGGHYYGFEDACPHEGCSLASGELDGTTVTCPCHGSQFDVRSGAVLEGPAEDPVTPWVVEVQGASLFIRPAS